MDYVYNNDGVRSHKMRVLSSYVLILLIEGQGRYGDVMHRPIKVQSGDVILLFPNVPHWFGPGPHDRWDEIFVEFHGPAFTQWQDLNILSPERPVYRIDAVRDWAKRIAAIAQTPRVSPEEQQLLMVGRLLSLLAELTVSNPLELELSHRPWLMEACRALETELAKDVDYQALAENFGLTYDQFRKQFAKAMGASPVQHRITRKIEVAKDLLHETDMSVQEISVSLGYYDQFAFSKAFKERVGLSPKDYRGAVRGQIGNGPAREQTMAD